MFYFASFGYVQASWEMIFGFLVVSLATSFVESLPISTELDDNLTVTLTSLLLGNLVFWGQELLLACEWVSILSFGSFCLCEWSVNGQKSYLLMLLNYYEPPQPSLVKKWQLPGFESSPSELNAKWSVYLPYELEEWTLWARDSL